MSIQNSREIPPGSSFDQKDSWLRLSKFRTLVCTKDFFETHGQGILAFTNAVCKENFDQACLNKNLVNSLYTVEVMNIYGGPDGPEANKLLNQLDSPLVQRFWACRSSAATVQDRKSNHESTEYHWSSEPPRAEQAADGCVVLTNSNIDVLVPRVGLIPLLSLDLAQVERDIRAANAMTFGQKDMRKIKRGILVSIYSQSEPETSRLAELMEMWKLADPPEKKPATKHLQVCTEERGHGPMPSSEGNPAPTNNPAGRSSKGLRKPPHRAKKTAGVLDRGSHSQVSHPSTTNGKPDLSFSNTSIVTSEQNAVGSLGRNSEAKDSATEAIGG